MNQIQKKMAEVNIENGLESKRNEMAEKRAQELLDSYLKVKNLRVI